MLDQDEARFGDGTQPLGSSWGLESSLHNYRRTQLLYDAKMFPLPVTSALFQEFVKFDMRPDDDSASSLPDPHYPPREPRYLCMRRHGTLQHVKEDEFLNERGEFVHGDYSWKEENDSCRVQGRMRIVICSQKGTHPNTGISLNREDFTAVEEKFHLHPATLQYSRRAMTASRYWVLDSFAGQDLLNVILSFPPVAQSRYNYISLTYDVSSNTATALIRESQIGEPSDFTGRLYALKERWSHPFCIPVVMLDLQLRELEREIVSIDADITALEDLIGEMVDLYEVQQTRVDGRSMTELVRESHRVVQRSARLLDALKWMHRAVELLFLAGQELQKERKLRELGKHSPLEDDWLEIRQYLEDSSRLCTSLEAEPALFEKRCQAQAEILYTKMAQEDNQMNTRMAMAVTHDNSSTKVLAALIALFLPGTFVAALFGMSMFNWQAEVGSSGGSNSGQGLQDVVIPQIWIYWAITGGLTAIVFFSWRIWWVYQDRGYRRRLLEGLSASSSLTWPQVRDAQQALSTSFLHDFWRTRSHKPKASSVAPDNVRPPARLSGQRRLSRISFRSPSLNEEHQDMA